MRIPCPLCGPRDLREFSVRGAQPGPRPGPDASAEDWHDFVYLRPNPAGLTDEFWQHLHGCGAWLVVRRETSSHRIDSVQLASSAVESGGEVPE